jgi:pyruvate/2-oxoglutarate/acetoin dehydrogenase E1 component
VTSLPHTCSGYPQHQADSDVGTEFVGLKLIVEFKTLNFAIQVIHHIISSAVKTLCMSGGQRAGQLR